MIACSPKAVWPRESTVEETNERDDVDWVGVVLGDLKNNFGNFRLQLFGEYPWFCSEGVGEMGGVKTLNLLEDLDCLELCELSFAMSNRTRDNKRWAALPLRIRQCWPRHLSIKDHMPHKLLWGHIQKCPLRSMDNRLRRSFMYCWCRWKRSTLCWIWRLSKMGGNRDPPRV